MVMLTSASLLVICCGVLCLKDTDLAWQLFEWDCRMMSMNPPRLADWRLRVRQAGYGLISLGVFGVIVGLGL